MSNYYSLNRILKNNSIYNMIIGERSNGKTYSTLLHSIKDYLKDRESQLGYVRRWKEDVTGRRAGNIFTALFPDIKKLSNGEFEGVHYYSGKFYLCTYDGKGKAIYSEKNILGYCFAISDQEHNKSNSFPKIKNVVFDEFITNGMYLKDEFVLFMNTLSTIIRDRSDVKIFMLGNTISKQCPYFLEMGLESVKDMKQGTIDLYKYGNSDLSVSVEYCATRRGVNKASKYFAFNNPKLEMITNGAWSLDLYPHIPCKYNKSDIVFTYFIENGSDIYQADIINSENLLFTYIHEKTTKIKNEFQDFILTNKTITSNNMFNNLSRTNKIHSRIIWFFDNRRVYYQNNTIGEAIKHFLLGAKNGY